MKIENETARKLIDEVLSDRVNQKDIDTLSFFLYPHTTKYQQVYGTPEDNGGIDVVI